jgi:hypothetical protein
MIVQNAELARFAYRKACVSANMPRQRQEEVKEHDELD